MQVFKVWISSLWSGSLCDVPTEKSCKFIHAILPFNRLKKRHLTFFYRAFSTLFLSPYRNSDANKRAKMKWQNCKPNDWNLCCDICNLAFAPKKSFDMSSVNVSTTYQLHIIIASKNNYHFQLIITLIWFNSLLLRVLEICF